MLVARQYDKDFWMLCEKLLDVVSIAFRHQHPELRLRLRVALHTLEGRLRLDNHVIRVAFKIFRYLGEL